MKTLLFSIIVGSIACANHIEWLACVSFVAIGISFLDCLMAALSGDKPDLP